MRRQLLLSLGALALTACATMQGGQTRETEQVLAAAGFQVRSADTPQQLAHLQTLTPGKVLLRPRNGAPHYVYADPTGCKCLYVGTDEQYQQYRKLEWQKAVADEASRASGESWAGMDFWGLWP